MNSHVISICSSSSSWHVSIIWWVCRKEEVPARSTTTNYVLPITSSSWNIIPRERCRPERRHGRRTGYVLKNPFFPPFLIFLETWSRRIQTHSLHLKISNSLLLPSKQHKEGGFQKGRDSNFDTAVSIGVRRWLSWNRVGERHQTSPLLLNHIDPSTEWHLHSWSLWLRWWTFEFIFVIIGVIVHIKVSLSCGTISTSKVIWTSFTFGLRKVHGRNRGRWWAHYY